MSDLQTQTLVPQLDTIFPDWVRPDDRAGYQGYIVETEHLLAVAKALRDTYGYDLLSSVTGVDYLPEGKLEVVYHVFRTTGGPIFVYKVQVPRDNPVVPSLVPLYPGAELQEREAYDLLGIRFEGHPDLRRILTWEGFAGHPLRKDWHEPYFEEEAKPYKSRWPEGQVRRAEDLNPFADNVDYPAGFDPESLVPDADDTLYKTLFRVQQAQHPEIKTDAIVVNLGPQHPSTHGVFRMVALLEGEKILDLKPVMGYLHRNHEKIAERNTFLQNMPFTDRLDYIASMSNNFAYALAVEKLMGVQPPERAEYIRVIMAELTRIVSHFIAVGFLLNDLGAFFTPSLYGIKERELIVDIFEMVSGSRMMCNYFRFGGLARDMSPEAVQKTKELVNDRLPRKIDEFDRYLTENEIVRQRCEGVGVLTPEDAIALSATGPVLRASGVPYDVRRAEPYSIYDRFEFDVAYGLHGDIYDRYLVRMEEMRQSVRILKQALRDLPEGPIMTGKPAYQVRVPAGESYGRVEGPKGELGFYLVSNGKPNPWRYHVRAPTFINLTSLAPMSRGGKVADVVAILGSIDIVLGEVDR
ncbi:NADH:ubiquinone oxidoreductase 49 kD subunit 7 [Levilinea saccharolytica]|nr:NADH-quinone oxidoreductase subunit D [Levilinea saccharolytica]GAP18166.1 NADH:ubiquinone oxidoreductase 49 kD subunit 7 [Levilinea saccharolytica]